MPLGGYDPSGLGRYAASKRSLASPERPTVVYRSVAGKHAILILFVIYPQGTLSSEGTLSWQHG